MTPYQEQELMKHAENASKRAASADQNATVAGVFSLLLFLAFLLKGCAL